MANLKSPNSHITIHSEKLPYVSLDQPNYFRLSLRLTVAEIDPDGNRQTKLRRHDLRIVIIQLALTDKKADKPGEISHDIRIILLGLQCAQLRILKLLNSQHLAGLADLRIMQDITHMS